MVQHHLSIILQYSRQILNVNHHLLEISMICLTPPGEDPDTYKPSTDSDGKTVAQRRDEAYARADENIKNGTCGWDEEDIEASKDILRKRLEDLGWSQEKIEEALNS